MFGRYARSHRQHAGDFGAPRTSRSTISAIVPDYPLPPGETVSSFSGAAPMKARAGATSLHRPRPPQIERELKLIEKLGLGGYFLIVWDIVRFCREEGDSCQGRGSAANSAVCYSLASRRWIPSAWICCSSVSLRRARRMARHRSRSAQRREARTRHPIRLQALWQHGAAMTANVITYRGRWRRAKPARCWASMSARSIRSPVSRPCGASTIPTKPAAVPGSRARSRNPRVRKFLEIVTRCRTCRGISASIRAAW